MVTALFLEYVTNIGGPLLHTLFYSNLSYFFILISSLIFLVFLYHLLYSSAIFHRTFFLLDHYEVHSVFIFFNSVRFHLIYCPFQILCINLFFNLCIYTSEFVFNFGTSTTVIIFLSAIFKVSSFLLIVCCFKG